MERKKDSKKKKHKKHHKKEKKLKRNRSPSNASSTDSDSRNPSSLHNALWVEKSTNPSHSDAVPQRDSWMTEDYSFLGVANKEVEPEKKEIKTTEEGLVISSRELNPFLNGTLETDSKEPSSSTPAPLSAWEKIKVKRVYEIATSEGKSVEEVATSRFGSFEEFKRLESAMDNGKRHRKEEGDSRYRKSHRRSHFKIPNEYESKKSEEPRERIPIQEKYEKTTDINADPNKESAKRLRSLLDDASTEPSPVVERMDLGRQSTLMESHMAHSKASSSHFDSKKSKKRIQEEREEQRQKETAMSIAEMFKAEKQGGFGSIDAALARQIASDSTFQNNLEYLNDNMGRYSQGNKAQNEGMKMKMAIQDYKKSQSAMNKCWYCFKDGKKPDVRILALGALTYLALGKRKGLTEGHCYIIPIRHHATTLHCEDEEWVEIRNFMKCLAQMFFKQKKEVIFMETVVNFNHHRHAMIECIPLSAEAASVAPGYFKVALNNSDEVWSQHKKLIDTSQKGFRSSLTPKLPYFHVWFTLNGGYGHVVEDTSKFPEYFGTEVIAGILELSPGEWRKPRFLTPEELESDVQQFLKSWKDFDWTKMLEGGSYVE